MCTSEAYDLTAVKARAMPNQRPSRDASTFGGVSKTLVQLLVRAGKLWMMEMACSMLVVPMTWIDVERRGGGGTNEGARELLEVCTVHIATAPSSNLDGVAMRSWSEWIESRANCVFTLHARHVSTSAAKGDHWRGRRMSIRRWLLSLACKDATKQDR